MGQNPIFLTTTVCASRLDCRECGSWTVQVPYFASHTQNYLVTLWKAKVSPMVRVFAWIIAHGRMTTCDLIQKRQPHWWPPTVIYDV